MNRSILAAVALLGLAGCLLQPSISLDNLQLGKVGLSGTTMVADLTVMNPNLWPVTAKSITYELTVEGQPAGKGVYDKPFKVPARGTAPLSFPVDVGWGAALGGLGSAWSRGAINAETRGIITVESFIGNLEVPYVIQSRIEGKEPAPR